MNDLITLSAKLSVASASLKLLNLSQEYPSKKLVFVVKTSKHRDYDNFSHRDVRVTKLWSYDHVHNIIDSQDNV